MAVGDADGTAGRGVGAFRLFLQDVGVGDLDEQIIAAQFLFRGRQVIAQEIHDGQVVLGQPVAEDDVLGRVVLGYLPGVGEAFGAQGVAGHLAGDAGCLGGVGVSDGRLLAGPIVSLPPCPGAEQDEERGVGDRRPLGHGYRYDTDARGSDGGFVFVVFVRSEPGAVGDVPEETVLVFGV